ncbi:WecB/TagA/CpsF family glycosyltransferase [Mastigocoleus sp. MO_188.B34]|uniref:WecB/TagA/CpsF family glycosyltransferase n=1 Tax=Mastigocoleus sp. MO_188.B34 TaxID=3036635 RepID=UPI00262188F5|nr:WecB/TagA/CpsF family glycosyltransferase [Mastigocoleus sp. MO_188.B34]MDJ0697308.1 WecB/TagA/CpsF family glycosyltransferase [Mastigocoleus sp. MO_188.B34]
MRKIQILNLEIDNFSQNEFLQEFKSGVLFTPNVDHLMKLQTDLEFQRAYDMSDYKICDSQVIVYASKFLGTPLEERISGADFFPAFYNYHWNNQDIRIFLLGAGKGVASQAQKNINRKIGRNIIVGSYSPPFGFEKDPAECEHIVNIIKNSDATVVAVGLGSPKQEKWILNYKESLSNIKIFMGLGATIDFEAGRIKRCPKWMGQVGLEWLFRLSREPQRLWKRYLVDDIPFFLLVLKQKLNLYGKNNKTTIMLGK